ncbi:hypothetical protein BDZ91DRAFT_750404 [Kalaharituber pfeilii]|nr:hypothetical protein BDZ91DRAFT_750404 [Kalaharituber pfeilii]
MKNETDWTGGDPDSNDIYPSQVLLGQRFILPSPTGGKNVIAIARSQEIYITSLYALITNTIFVAWWILIAIAIPHLIPRRFIHEPSMTIITSWKINEPLQALFPLLHHLWHSISSFCKSRRAKQVQQNLSTESVKFSWADFTITLVTLVLALGAFVCGIVATLANPDQLLYPNDNSLIFEERTIRERAITVIDNANPHGSIRKLLDSRVFFETTVIDPPKDRRNESSYTMRYTSSVTGYDMGLIYASDLNITMHGKCDFDYNVVVSEEGRQSYTYRSVEDGVIGGFEMTNDTLSPEATFYCYDSLKENITTSFSVVPMLWGLLLLVDGGIYTDPWYFPNTSTKTIESARPMIRCKERLTVSYRGWEGTFSDLRDNKVPGLHVSTAVMRILEIHFGQVYLKEDPHYQTSPTCSFANSLPAHLTLGSTRKMSRDGLRIDSELTAANEMRRLVEGSYIYSKELFRSTAIYYSLSMNSNSSRGYVVDPNRNVFRTAEGEPIACDFILYSEKAAALRFETLVAIPTVLVFSWILVALCWRLRLSPPDSKSGEIADDTRKAKPGWYRSVKTMWR